MTRIAFYAGSFDPVTFGHLDVARGACRLADRLIFAIGVHPGKSPLFSGAERVALLQSVSRQMAQDAACEIDVVTFDGLVVHAARRAGATLLVRGVRDEADFADEMRMAAMNSALEADLQTVLIPAGPAARPISATLVRQIASMGGDVSAFVPSEVAKKLRERFKAGDQGVVV